MIRWLDTTAGAIAFPPPEAALTNPPGLLAAGGDLAPDRLLAAWAASRLHGPPVIIVDLGTATTVDAVDADGFFLGGAILPGLGLAADALTAPWAIKGAMNGPAFAAHVEKVLSRNWRPAPWSSSTTSPPTRTPPRPSLEGASCLVPACGGLLICDHQKDALWDKFFTAAPRPRTRSEQQYSDRKLRTRR